MKTLILIFTILISGLTTAQKSIEKNLGEFKELKAYDLIAVELIKSNENKAVISGSNIDDVLLVNKNGILKIKMSIGKAFDGNNTKVTLYYTSLDIIDANEGARIYGKDIIKQFEIDLRVQEGGVIEIPLDVTYTIAKAVTGGKITTNGYSKSQNISLLTGGIYNGELLKTDKTTISINAAGEAKVHAKKEVDAKIRAGGDIFVYGNPETINESKVLGGRIKRME